MPLKFELVKKDNNVSMFFLNKYNVKNKVK